VTGQDIFMDDERHGSGVPGINCLDCGRFVGRDGHIFIEYFEMSGEGASVEGRCRRCLDAEHRRLTKRAA
jgi:hypothetical protein